MTTSSNDGGTGTTSTRSSRSTSTKATTTAAPAPGSTPASDTSNVMFTAEGTDTTHGVPKVATAADYPDSKQAAAGEWNPETHGEPPDAKPVRNF